jgi:hypothetical protein
MSSPTAPYGSPFRLSHVSSLESAFLSLPLELRHIVYAEIFQPRTYNCKTTKTWLCPRPGLRPLQTCSCSFGGAVSLLRTCRQIYVEAQPHFLLSATLKLHKIAHINDQAHQLSSFYQKFLRSSLSGLIPSDCLRRLDLGFNRITDCAVYDDLNFINDCRLRLDYLQLEFVRGWPPSYCSTDFIYGYFFKAMSLLRDIKNVQLTWRPMIRSAMNPTLVRAFDEPAHHFSCAYLNSIQKRYYGLLNRAFSELTSRPWMTKDRKRSTTLYGEAREIFQVRMQELMEESRLYLTSDI